MQQYVLHIRMRVRARVCTLQFAVISKRLLPSWRYTYFHHLHHKLTIRCCEVAAKY